MLQFVSEHLVMSMKTCCIEYKTPYNEYENIGLSIRTTCNKYENMLHLERENLAMSMKTFCIGV